MIGEMALVCSLLHHAADAAVKPAVAEKAGEEPGCGKSESTIKLSVMPAKGGQVEFTLEVQHWPQKISAGVCQSRHFRGVLL